MRSNTQLHLHTGKLPRMFDAAQLHIRESHPPLVGIKKESPKPALVDILQSTLQPPYTMALRGPRHLRVDAVATSSRGGLITPGPLSALPLRSALETLLHIPHVFAFPHGLFSNALPTRFLHTPPHGFGILMKFLHMLQSSSPSCWPCV